MRMNLESLRCFCAIVQHGSFRAAAKSLHRSQPAISQQVKGLETALGCVLLDRKHNSLTPEGKLIYARAREILQATVGLRKELDDLHARGVQCIRVGTSDTMALYYLPQHIHAFTRAHPYTRLELVNRSSDAIAALVRQGELDLGIVTLPQDDAELREEPLLEQQLALVAPKGHPLAQTKRIDFAALETQPFLLLDVHTRTGSLLQACFAQHDFTPQVVLDSGSFEVIKRYVREGVGLSFLPVALLDDADEALEVIPFPGLPTIQIGAIRRHGAYQSRAESTLLEILKSQV